MLSIFTRDICRMAEQVDTSTDDLSKMTSHPPQRLSIQTVRFGSSPQLSSPIKLMFYRYALCLFIVAIGSNVGPIVFAQLPNPVLTELFPHGIQVGTTAEVTIGGRDIDEPTELIFSHPGIQAAIKVVPEAEFEPARNSTNQFTVEAAENVPPGIYEVRVVGRFGVSTPLSFVVHHETSAIETGDNHSVENASPLLIPSIVCGRADANHTDYYRISVDAGSTLAIECLADEIDSRIAPVVSILTASGRPLQRSRAVRDTTLTHHFGDGGEFIIALHDGTYAGGNEYVYALKITDRPVIDFVLPSAGQPGRITEFTFYGRNLLDGTNGLFELNKHQLSTFTRKIYIPTKQELNRSFSKVAGLRAPSFRYPAGDDSASGAEIAIGLATVSVVTESEPNERASATRVSLPIEYTGTLYPRRDQDWIRFAAKKGQKLQIEVHGSGNGIEIDPAVYVWKVVQAADGTETFVNRNVTDDAKLDGGRYGRRIPRALDYSGSYPSVSFTIPDDGDYCVSVRDLYGNARNDPRSLYRLTVQLSKPTFQLVAWCQRFRTENNNKKVERASLSLRPGESREVLVDVVRQGGFQGEVTLSASKLPNGVSCSDIVVAAGQTEAAIVLTASADAQPTYGAVRVVGSATVEGTRQSRLASIGLLTSDVGNISAARPSHRMTGELFVSVSGTTEKAPAVVKLGDRRTWQTSVGATLRIPVAFEPNSKIKGDLKMNSIELPGEIKPKEIVLKPDSDSTLEIPLNNPKVKPGKYSFFLTGQVAANFTRNQHAISSVEKQIADFESTMKQLIADEQAALANRDQLRNQLTTLTKDAANDSNESAPPIKTARAAVADAEKVLQEATSKKTRAESFQKSLQERLNNAKKQNGPRDAQIVVTSSPVTIDVAKSPLTYTAPDLQFKIPASRDDESKATTTFAIERNYGFAEAVDISVSVPEGHPDVSISSLNKDQTRATISCTIRPETKPGRYEYPIAMKLKFGGVDIQDTTKLTVNVLKPPASTSPMPDTAAQPAAEQIAN